MRASTPWTLALAFAVGGSACERHGTEPVVNQPLDAAVAVITAAGVASDVSVLAADSMGGRRTPSPGLAASA